MLQGNKEINSVEIISILKNLPIKNLPSVSDRCGAYVIKVKSGKNYVGSSKTVRTRVASHQVYNDPNITEPIESVCIYLTKSHMDARILENWLIREIKPELNKSYESGTTNIASKCIRDCETWEAPGRHVRIDVDIQNILKDIDAEDISSSLRESPGAYVITTMTNKLYVGSSNALLNRMRSHMDYKEGKNISEPIKSVCCYYTNDEMDARILEYQLIRKLKPELNREIQPDASRWKKGSKAMLLSDSKDELRELFEKFSQRILASSGVKEVVRKGWITYQLSQMKNFCAVKIKSNYLEVDLKADIACFKDPLQFSREIKPTQAWTFNRRLELRSMTEIDKAFELIQQAYEFMKQ